MTHSAWSRLGVAGKTAAVAAGLAALVLVLTVPALAIAIFTPRPAPQQPPSAPGGTAAERLKGQLAQVDGRSLFFIPTAPPPPPPPPPKDDGPRTPPKPTEYKGPALIAMINDTAWFADGKVLSIGADPKGGMRLISLDPPWTATVEWSGVEFQVPLFEPDTVVFKKRPATPPTAATPATDTPPSSEPAPPPPATGDTAPQE